MATGKRTGGNAKGPSGGGGKSAAGGEKPAARGRGPRPKGSAEPAPVGVTVAGAEVTPAAEKAVRAPAHPAVAGLEAATAAARQLSGDLTRVTEDLRETAREMRALRSERDAARAELGELRAQIRAAAREAEAAAARVSELRRAAERPVAPRPAPAAAESANRLGVAVDPGVVVAEVLPGGMAAEAGLGRGDVIESVNGAPVHTAAGLREAVLGVPDGSELTVRIRRGGAPLLMVGRAGPAGEDGNRLGVVAAPGVVVAGVMPDSPAAAAGLAGGDVIERAAGREVRSGDDFREAVLALPPGAEVALAVTRGGEVREVVARLDRAGDPGPHEGNEADEEDG